ncbi:hypothetical protein FACS1894172_18060 [Spirochaetia bacterium]|nr:hypothetical protein FACS1894172_18060 [Spirochaetia bacterium]
MFFDMGFEINGWRYLEAAPQDFPTKVKWCNKTDSVTIPTETGIGMGKQNTKNILAYLTKRDETIKAAQVVSVPGYGGYNDWFLPSVDELDLMYKNLKKQGKGGFSNDIYWSSSWVDFFEIWTIDFSNGSKDGEAGSYNYNFDYLVRAIRQF